MFTDEEIQYMKNVLGLNLDFNNLSDDDWLLIEETVADRLGIYGFDENYEPTPDGLMCEALIDKYLEYDKGTAQAVSFFLDCQWRRRIF